MDSKLCIPKTRFSGDHRHLSSPVMDS
jgi:hypothetical protein